MCLFSVLSIITDHKFIYIYTYTVYYYNITCTRPPHAPLKKPGAFHRRGNSSIKAGMTDAAFLSSPGNLLIRPLSSKPSKVLGASQQCTTITTNRGSTS